MSVTRLSGSTGASTVASTTVAHPGAAFPDDTFRVASLFIASTGAVTLPNGNWNAAVDTTSGLGAAGRLVIAWRWQGSGDTASQVFSWGSSAGYCIRVNNYTGVDTFDPWDVAPDAANIASNTTGTALTANAITPGTPAYGIWVWMQTRSSGASTATIATPGSIDLADSIVRPTGAAGQVLQLGASTALTAGASSGTRVGTANGSGPWRAIPFALREAGLGPEPGRRLLLAA